MARVLSFPFRFNGAGRAATVEQDSDTYYSQQLATILLTIQNEREYIVEFGMPDMAFDGFMHSAFNNQVEEYLSGITDIDVEIVDVTETTQRVEIRFQSGDE